MKYNTTREKLLLPEYGRMVQEMVQKALTLESRSQRQEYAQQIINVMAGLNPQMRHIPDYKHKLWDHLAYMSGYRLDIDYPVSINQITREEKPARLAYPGGKMRHKHYGRLLENFLQRIEETEDKTQQDKMVHKAAARMRRNLADWKGEGYDNQTIENDIAEYTQGAVQPDLSQWQNMRTSSTTTHTRNKTWHPLS